MCRGERAVLTGDFNVGETSESYAVLRGSGLLYDTFDLAEIRYAWTGTENGFDPDRKTLPPHRLRLRDARLPGAALRHPDRHLPYRRSPRAARSRSVPARRSDHFPVQVELAFAE